MDGTLEAERNGPTQASRCGGSSANMFSDQQQQYRPVQNRAVEGGISRLEWFELHSQKKLQMALMLLCKAACAAVAYDARLVPREMLDNVSLGLDCRSDERQQRFFRVTDVTASVGRVELPAKTSQGVCFEEWQAGSTGTSTRWSQFRSGRRRRNRNSASHSLLRVLVQVAGGRQCPG